MLATLARVARAQGHEDEADSLIRRSIDANVRVGRDGDAANDGFALVFSLLERSALDEARRALAETSELARGDAEGETRAAYYRGRLAAIAGDERSALGGYRDARDRAARIDMRRLGRMIGTQLAIELDRAGRVDEALRQLESMAADAAGANACDLADLDGAIGWIALHQPASRPRRVYCDAARAIDRSVSIEVPKAVRAVSDRRHDGEPRAGRPRRGARCQGARAHARSGRARAATADRDGARVARHRRGDRRAPRGTRAPARDAFEELAAKGRTAGDVLAQTTGLEGSADARVALGDREGALADLARAADVVDCASAAFTLGEGRGSFVAAHERADARRVELLVDLG